MIEEKKIVNVVVLPLGKCSSKCCGDCLFMDTSDRNSYGDYYCGKKRKYYPAADSACSQFEFK